LQSGDLMPTRSRPPPDKVRPGDEPGLRTTTQDQPARTRTRPRRTGYACDKFRPNDGPRQAPSPAAPKRRRKTPAEVIAAPADVRSPPPANDPGDATLPCHNEDAAEESALKAVELAKLDKMLLRGRLRVVDGGEP
jgi:hypothetical protein